MARGQVERLVSTRHGVRDHAKGIDGVAFEVALVHAAISMGSTRAHPVAPASSKTTLDVSTLTSRNSSG